MSGSTPGCSHPPVICWQRISREERRCSSGVVWNRHQCGAQHLSEEYNGRRRGWTRWQEAGKVLSAACWCGFIGTVISSELNSLSHLEPASLMPDRFEHSSVCLKTYHRLKLSLRVDIYGCYSERLRECSPHLLSFKKRKKKKLYSLSLQHKNKPQYANMFTTSAFNRRLSVITMFSTFSPKSKFHVWFMFEQEMLRNLKTAKSNQLCRQLLEFLLYNDFSDDQNSLCFISWLSTNRVID